jgi:hypothetical protein
MYISHQLYGFCTSLESDVVGNELMRLDYVLDLQYLSYFQVV